MYSVINQIHESFVVGRWCMYACMYNFSSVNSSFFSPYYLSVQHLYDQLLIATITHTDISPFGINYRGTGW